mgnify:CR=1 FL=1
MAWGDAKSILRDSTMVLAVFGPIAIFFLLFMLPLIEQMIWNRFNFDLIPYRLFGVSFLSLIPGMLFGMIYGFIMLDERDEDIISFISVTPLQKQGYLSYKLQIPMLLSSGFFLLFVYGTQLIDLTAIHAPFIAVMVAMEAAIGALFLVAYADNKVEGLAYSKMFGIIFLAVPAVFFWQSPWHWMIAWLPPFWIAKAFVHSTSGSWLVWTDLLIGVSIHFACFLFFLRAFLNKQK